MNAQQCWTEDMISDSVGAKQSVYATDVTSDGNTDVLSATGYDDRIFLYENDGNENFTVHLITDSPLQAEDVYATDVNGDG